MTEGMLDIGRAAFDFVDDIERMSDQRALVDRFGRELNGYGYHAWIIANLPNPGGRTDSLALLSGWPQGWTALYRRLKLIHNDPVVAHCLRSTAASVVVATGRICPIARPSGDHDTVRHDFVGPDT